MTGESGSEKGKRVWVFGAGIAGLTAAHELAERGFTVTVIEPAEDPRFYGRPALGGMARTQWAVPERQAQDKLLRWKGSRALALLPKKRLYFKTDGVPGTPPVLKHERKLCQYAAAFAKIYRDAAQVVPRIRVKGFQRDTETAGTAEKRAKAVADKLRDCLQERCLLPEETLRRSVSVTGVARPRWPYPEDRSNRACVEIEIMEVPVPAEHGFRFFPSFYRHVFDTMGRIRLLDDRTGPSSRPFRTVLDNVVPTRTVTVALPVAPEAKGAADVTPDSLPAVTKRPDGGGGLLTFPRESLRSLLALRDLLLGVFERLGHTESDVAHLALKMAKYLTSGERRRQEYEGESFSRFLDVDRLSAQCKLDVEAAPEVLAGMRSTESDARTQGSAAVQLLLNQLTGTADADATLNGPTTSAWFAPWREYLELHGVTFVCAELTGLDGCDAPAGSTGKRVVPTVKMKRDGAPHPKFDADDWFVMAVSLPALLPPDRGGKGLCAQFQQACGGEKGAQGDFAKLGEWIDHVGNCWPWNVETPVGPFRNVSGIQYYFETNQEPTRGHTIYADSPWRLSSISQVAFWTQARTSSSGYRGVVSVDIGEWNGKPDGIGKTRGQAWGNEPDDIADEVWKQIRVTLPKPSASPSFYHLDDAMVFRERRHGYKYKNATPYLIARPEDWPYRPGEVQYGPRSPESPAKSGYQVAAGRWVVCGTFMKTFTRMTTMESANESARHAVNALLDAFEKVSGNESKNVPRCRIFPLEDHELDDLKWLREMDDQLHKANLPHALDVFEAHAWIDALLPTRGEKPKKG